MSELPELTKEDLLIFAYERGNVRFKDFSEFCRNSSDSTKPAKIARQTMTNYLNDLKGQGKLKKNIAEGARYPHYYVPKEYHEECMKLKEKRTLLEIFETMDVTQFIKTLKNTLFRAFSPMLEDTLKIMEIHSPEDLEKFVIESGHKEEDIMKMWLDGTIFDPVSEVAAYEPIINDDPPDHYYDPP